MSRSRSSRKQKDPEGFAKENRENVNRCRSSKKQKDPEGLAQKERERLSRSRSSKKQKDPEGLAREERNRQQKSKEERLKTKEGRIAAFRKSVMYGACFPCVCCHRVMFKDQVVGEPSFIKKRNY